MITAIDIAREGQIRRLAKQMRHADQLRDRDEARRLQVLLRDQIMARRPEVVHLQEQARGLA